MASISLDSSCLFLDRLPVEIRLEIYSYLLTFSHPLKLRQVIPGSRDLAILRINHQIHDEALSVLYDSNTIVVTRNDFCIHTDPHLKTPLRQDQARTLLISSFSQSIACTLRGPDRRCAVCHPSASGLFDTLRSMPKLREVTIDFSRHVKEMLTLMNTSPGLVPTLPEHVDASTQGDGDGEGDGGGRRRNWRRLRGEAVEGLRVSAVMDVLEDG